MGGRGFGLGLPVVCLASLFHPAAQLQRRVNAIPITQRSKADAVLGASLHGAQGATQ